jgi:hypothetical protein
MIEHITRRRILDLIKEAVKFMPESMGDARVNSYAVISSISDFNKDNFGYKTEDLNVDAWTREQSTFNRLELKYPLVCPTIYSGRRKYEKGNLSYSQTDDQIRISVVDRYIDQKTSEDDASLRSVTQIFDDTEKALNKIIEYLFAIQAYKVEVTTGVYTYDYYHPDYLAYLLTNSKIVGYVSASSLSILNTFNNSYLGFVNSNLNLNIERIDQPISKGNLVGSQTTLNCISIHCHDALFDFFVDDQVKMMGR